MTSTSTLGKGYNPCQCYFKGLHLNGHMISQTFPWWHFIAAFIHFSRAITVAVGTPQQARATGRDESASLPGQPSAYLQDRFHLPGSCKHPIIAHHSPQEHQQGLK